MNQTYKKIDTAIVVKRVLFSLVLIILAFGNLFALFRGLDAPLAMDQAQIAREIARGNGFVTKFIRPVAYQDISDHEDTIIAFDGFKDSYHAPLNPLLNAAVLKLIGADDPDSWVMQRKEMVYPLDRVIATVSTLCFLLAIGVTFITVTKIFDENIASVTALLMLFCQTFWDYSLSGLPQMLMLLLFSGAVYFIFRAVEKQNEDEGKPQTPALIAAVLLSLLALTHYLTIWIALGYIAFAVIVFRPRGIIALWITGIIALPLAYIVFRNFTIDGTPFGAAFYNLYNGMGGGSEDVNLRNLNASGLTEKGIIFNTVGGLLSQAVHIVPFLGGIFVAPIFFIALLHPYRRKAIADFRWCVLLMFACSALGLTFFGVSSVDIDSNQTHLLFAPIMIAYGLSFISVLWSRISLGQMNPILQYIHYIVIVIICAMPLILSLPSQVKMGLSQKDKGGIPQWPPYFPNALNISLKEITQFDDMIFSDQPWATAWYADRVSIWLPQTVEDFEKIEGCASDVGSTIAGIFISPSSHGSGNVAQITRDYKNFTALVLDGSVTRATYPPGLTISDKSQKIRGITRRYSQRTPLVGLQTVFYSKMESKEVLPDL